MSQFKKWVRNLKMLIAKDVIDEIKAAAALVIDGYAEKLKTANLTAEQKTNLAAASLKAAQLQMAKATEQAAAAEAFKKAVDLLSPEA
jgi:hypothetical protein